LTFHSIVWCEPKRIAVRTAHHSLCLLNALLTVTQGWTIKSESNSTCRRSILDQVEQIFLSALIRTLISLTLPYVKFIKQAFHRSPMRPFMALLSRWVAGVFGRAPLALTTASSFLLRILIRRPLTGGRIDGSPFLSLSLSLSAMHATFHLTPCPLPVNSASKLSTHQLVPISWSITLCSLLSFVHFRLNVALLSLPPSLDFYSLHSLLIAFFSRSLFNLA